jgi:hypothetical protein
MLALTAGALNLGHATRPCCFSTAVTVFPKIGQRGPLPSYIKSM